MAAILFALALAVVAADSDPPPGAVLIPIDLQKSVIRVTADPAHVPASHVAVDIGFSEHLLRVPAPPRVEQPSSVIVRANDNVDAAAIEAMASLGDKYSTVASNLRDDDEFHGVFEAGIKDTVVGVWVKRVDRGDKVVVEIRPMYILPSGMKQSLTKQAGMKAVNRGHQTLMEAMSAEKALPQLQSAVGAAEGEYQRYMLEAQRQANGQTLRSYAAGQPTPAVMANNSLRRGRALSRQLQRANVMAERLPAIKVDVVAVNEVARYSALIADKATIFVFAHADGKPVTASVR